MKFLNLLLLAVALLTLFTACEKDPIEFNGVNTLVEKPDYTSDETVSVLFWSSAVISAAPCFVTINRTGTAMYQRGAVNMNWADLQNFNCELCSECPRFDLEPGLYSYSVIEGDDVSKVLAEGMFSVVRGGCMSIVVGEE